MRARTPNDVRLRPSMVEGFAPQAGGKKPLSDLGMTESRTALLPLALGLQGIPGGDGKGKVSTTDRVRIGSSEDAR